MRTITTHYIDGTLAESRGREMMDIIKPTNGKVIGRVALGDENDARLAIDAARRAFATYGRSTREERAEILRSLHRAASARLDDLTAAMVEEYGGVVQFADDRESTRSWLPKRRSRRWNGRAVGTKRR